MAGAILQAGTIQTKAGRPVSLTKQDGLKTWITYNNSTTVINASFNVSSATHNGTGDFTVTLTNNMSSTSYAPAGLNGQWDTGASNNDTPVMGQRRIAYTASAYRMICGDFTSSGFAAAYDATGACSGTLGTLA